MVRLPFILLFALSSVLMWRIGCLAGGPAGGVLGGRGTESVAGVRRHDGKLGVAGRAAGCRAAGGGAVPAACPAGDAAGRPGVVAAAGLCAGLALFSKYSAVLTIGGRVRCIC